MTEHETHMRVETEVPEHVSSESLRELLSALAAADWWVVVNGRWNGCTAWAAVNKETPAALDARGHGHQL
ncbi:hypothetical protein ACFY97_20605 [Streptomyces klenkii]|uniref:hypothetical protein n=1 Tax=Streptomyces klenkii TaxID=1420899 RepID=UPI0036ED80E5